MSIHRISRNWFKFSVNIFNEEDKEYCRPSNRYFDENTFAWQKVACKFYLLTNNWIIATGKELPQIPLRMKCNIEDLTQLYRIVRGIIEELLRACYFDNI